VMRESSISSNTGGSYRLRLGSTDPYDVLIREAEERYDRLMEEQGRVERTSYQTS
jgi:hypothetical protein